MIAFIPETVIDEVRWFRDGKFTTYCKEVASQRFISETDPAFQSQCDIIRQKCRGNVEDFYHLALQLDTYILGRIKTVDTSSSAMKFFMDNIKEIRSQFEKATSEFTLEEKIFGKFNQDAIELDVVMEDYVDENTGEVKERIKYDVKGVPVFSREQSEIFYILFQAIIHSVRRVLDRNIIVGMNLESQKPMELDKTTDIPKIIKSLPPKPPPAKYIRLGEFPEDLKNTIIDSMHESLYSERISTSLPDFKKHFYETEGDYDKMKWGGVGTATSLKIFFKELYKENIIINGNINQIIYNHFKDINVNSLSVFGAKGRSTYLSQFEFEETVFKKIKALAFPNK